MPAPLGHPQNRELAGRGTAAGNTVGRSAHGVQPHRLVGAPEEKVGELPEGARSLRRCSLSPKDTHSDRANPNEPLPNVTICTIVKTISTGLRFYVPLALPSPTCVQLQRHNPSAYGRLRPRAARHGRPNDNSYGSRLTLRQLRLQRVQVMRLRKISYIPRP
jgi:hypothetical protein